ncbi:RNA-dependent ATPase [Coemansia javaensis]|uniref:RNA helicase n=1 Tax=Coemansia javaensis TaxID=2761396 RepID=A0A9W8LM03_9FUNG|nr:RNA-dependent ATPase [Coemansia javaensis]
MPSIDKKEKKDKGDKGDKRDKKEKKEKSQAGHKQAKDKECKRKRGAEAAADAPAKKAKGATAGGVTGLAAAEFYAAHSITVSGSGSAAFAPYLEFGQTPFSSSLLAVCARFAKPTPIQSACWPIVAGRRDAVGIAETGSGKTLAFGLPVLHLVAQDHGARVQQCRRPLVLVMSPTRELAIQTHEQFAEAGRALGIASCCLYGGANKGEQLREVKRARPAVVVATPGRLLDVVENDRAVDLSEVAFLVLDEADRMLDQGFEKDIRAIIAMLPQGARRQTVMFSATWPQSVRSLADSFLSDPVKVSVKADELAVNERVDQVVEVVDRMRKDARLLELLKAYHRTRRNRVLVFVLYKKEAARVEDMLRHKGFKCVGIHGDKSQAQRLEAIEAFRSGTVPLMVATDVAARGLDVPDIEYVINYTFPLTIDEYTHRCGRTARAGKKGVAHTLFTDADKAHSGSLINVLRQAGMPVPDSLLRFGTTVKKKAHASYGAFFKDVDPGAKPTKITFA